MPGLFDDAHFTVFTLVDNRLWGLFHFPGVVSRNGPASINDEPSLNGTARVDNLNRTVRGLTNEIEKGNEGS
jgi:hypothetical protein